MKTGMKYFVLTLAILSIVNTTALAADKHQIIITKNGSQSVVSESSGKVVPSQPGFGAGLTKIYDNFSVYPLGTYWCCYAWSITGTGSGNSYQSIGIPFTPSNNATIKTIGVGVGWSGGANEVTVSVNADAAGIPGDSLGSFQVTGMPIEGTCCRLSGKGNLAIPVTAGIQYWIVVQPTTPDSSTWADWNWNDTDQVDTFQPYAWNGGGGWNVGSGYPAAFAVLGTTN